MMDHGADCCVKEAPFALQLSYPRPLFCHLGFPPIKNNIPTIITIFTLCPLPSPNQCIHSAIFQENPHTALFLCFPIVVSFLEGVRHGWILDLMAMDRALSHRDIRQQQQQPWPRHKVADPKTCHSLFTSRIPSDASTFSVLTIWASKSIRSLYCRTRASSGSSQRHRFAGMVTYNSVYCASPYLLEANEMDGWIEKNERKREGLGRDGDGFNKAFGNVIEDECGESSSSSDFLASEETTNSGTSSHSMNWQIPNSSKGSNHTNSHALDDLKNGHLDEKEPETKGSSFSGKEREIEMMKERFAKLLLGEDMSGCGNGVCTALAISNAITNLCRKSSLFHLSND